MIDWDLGFITQEDFKNHVSETIRTYEGTLKSINLAKFNSNIIDPIKLTFDSKVYRKTLEDIITDEIVRQRDKSNTNAIGYFHQKIFNYIAKCEVPVSGWDIIHRKDNGTKIVVEMKNKHNTMNSSSSQKTYMKMQNHILNNPNDNCYLVEVIASKSQNITWVVSLDGTRVSSPKIKRVSVDKFYAEVTNDRNAFRKICTVLPCIIEEVVDGNADLTVANDTVLSELAAKNPDTLKALYLLAFESYEGFGTRLI